MIITLKGAKFSVNIGQLDSWNVSHTLGTGATYSGPATVMHGTALNASVTIAEGYTIGTNGITITMGGAVLNNAYTVSGNTITVAIAVVTSNVMINVPTLNINTGEEDSGDSDFGEVQELTVYASGSVHPNNPEIGAAYTPVSSQYVTTYSVYKTPVAQKTYTVTSTHGLVNGDSTILAPIVVICDSEDNVLGCIRTYKHVSSERPETLIVNVAEYPEASYILVAGKTGKVTVTSGHINREIVASNAVLGTDIAVGSKYTTSSSQHTRIYDVYKVPTSQNITYIVGLFHGLYSGEGKQNLPAIAICDENDIVLEVILAQQNVATLHTETFTINTADYPGIASIIAVTCGGALSVTK